MNIEPHFALEYHVPMLHSACVYSGYDLNYKEGHEDIHCQLTSVNQLSRKSEE